ncbi:prepilin-type N-terminal cleavage/methylation domain-containing protein [Thiomicrorhabdus hydrogeniphila]
MQVKNLQKQQGFTLVEIAIVLVIIGLLLGGVLKGQELIQNAKVKSLSQQFDNVAAAYYAYQDRKTTFPDTADDDAFWYELKNEGFISGTLGTSADSSGPTNSFDGLFYVVVGGGNSLITDQAYVCASNVPNDVAQSIDTKTDDGANDTGSVRSVPVADGAAASYTTEGNIGLCKQL